MLRLISAARGWAGNLASNLRSNLDVLQNAWVKVDESYGTLLNSHEGIDDPSALERSLLAEHLEDLVRAVVQEEEANAASGKGTTDTGPCFEFLLQQNVVDKLCALGMPDRPPGMRTLITRTLDSLFSRTRKPLLPNMSVHLAVRQFINICESKGDLRRPSSKRPFLHLMRTLCTKLRDDPSLAWVFFEDRASMEQEFIIFKSLLPLVNDGDEHADAAIEGILCCVQLPDAKVTRYIVEGTDFSNRLVGGLRAHFAALPAADAAGGAGGGGSAEVLVEALPDTPQLRRFWTRLRLADVVAGSTHGDLAAQVANQFRDSFLFEELRPRLLSVNEEEARLATVHLRHVVQEVESPALRAAIVEFLFGGARKGAPETPGEEAVSRLRATLVRRIDSLNDALAVATLGLFDALLATRSEAVFGNLVLRSLRPCRHVASAARRDHARADACALVRLSDLAARFEGHDVGAGPELEQYLLDAQGEAQQWVGAYSRWSLRSRPRNGSDVEAVVSELDLEELAAAAARARASSAEKKEGQEDGQERPQEAEAEDHRQDDQEDEPFYEGLFLRTLVHVLEAALDKPFAINLLVTSVLSRLAQCPHPLLHGYMLDPRLRTADGVRSFVDVLSAVWGEARSRANAMPDFERRLADVRARLGAGYNSVGVEAMDVVRYLQAVVVLDEFIRELVAVSQAKGQVQALLLSAQRNERSHDPPDALTL